MGSMSKPKAPQPTAAEQALQRAQVAELASQEQEINARRRRIVRGQGTGRAGLLRAGLTGARRPSGSSAKASASSSGFDFGNWNPAAF